MIIVTKDGTSHKFIQHKVVTVKSEGQTIQSEEKMIWKDEKGNPCGSAKNKRTKVCRPSRRVSSKSPKTWSQMTKSERSKVVRAKKKVGMGRRRSSKSNVS